MSSQTKASSASNGEKALKWILGICLAVGGVLVILPFVWMILSAFKPEGEIQNIPPTLLPERFTTENFKNLFENMNFGVYLKTRS